MNPAFIALGSAACWGSSDFLGGVTARRVSPYLAVATAHAISLAIILAVIFSFGLHAPGQTPLTLGLIGGLFGGGGLMLFYQALSTGSMGITAAAAGVLTAAVPVLFGLHAEGLPTSHQLFGLILAVIAIWLIASTPGRVNLQTLWLGCISGACFGIYFVLLKLASSGGPSANIAWAMAMSRVTSATLASLFCLWSALKANPGAMVNRGGGRTLALVTAVGLLDTGGNLLYMFATRLGRMDVAAVLSSLYPAATILLAAWLLKERTTRTQTVGLVLAVGAVALIAG
jgi:drug/metabolite transporter (DMT)-like permease